jgi:hypothetical protein
MTAFLNFFFSQKIDVIAPVSLKVSGFFSKILKLCRK